MVFLFVPRLSSFVYGKALVKLNEEMSAWLENEHVSAEIPCNIDATIGLVSFWKHPRKLPTLGFA